jgi:hypothetical protein
VEDLLRRAPESETASEDDGEDAPAFQRGDLVEVRRYGRGVVEQATALQVTVAFADRTRRSFLPEYVRRAGRGRATAGLPSSVSSPGPASAGTAPARKDRRPAAA